MFLTCLTTEVRLTEGKDFRRSFNVSINLEGTNPKLIYLDPVSFLLFLLPPLAL